MTGTDEPAPLLRVVRGEPTDAELAALTVAVLAARAAGAGADGSVEPVGGWADRRAGLRRPLAIGPGAWARSGREPGVRTRAAW